MRGDKFALKEVFMSNLIHAAVSNKVLGAAFTVHGALGSGLVRL
jgi:hypothetical protein